MEKVVSHRPLWTCVSTVMNMCIDRYEHVHRPLRDNFLMGFTKRKDGFHATKRWFLDNNSIVIIWFTACYRFSNIKQLLLFFTPHFSSSFTKSLHTFIHSFTKLLHTFIHSFTKSLHTFLHLFTKALYTFLHSFTKALYAFYPLHKIM